MLQPTFHRLRVASVQPLTDDAVALTFEVPEHLRADYAFLAGQHITILGRDGGRRSFSLCAAPSTGVLRIGVKRIEGGAFSDEVVGELQVGDELDVMTPAGGFVAVPDPARRASYVAIAAGSGITPILSMVAALLEGEPQSSVTLIYANRTAASVMFIEEVQDLKDRFLSRLQVLHVLSREECEAPMLSGRLDAERLGALLAAFVDAERVDDWFLCGPQPMVAELSGMLTDAGLGRVHSELFHAEAPVRRPLSEVDTADGAARVTIRLAGRATEFSLHPNGPSVLEAAVAVRQDLPFACKGGVCGTCRAHLAEGTVAMDLNYALEPQDVAQGYVLTCQSHPTSARVVLDYDA